MEMKRRSTLQKPAANRENMAIAGLPAGSSETAGDEIGAFFGGWDPTK